jgi:hypothetical protein
VDSYNLLVIIVPMLKVVNQKNNENLCLKLGEDSILDLIDKWPVPSSQDHRGKAWISYLENPQISLSFSIKKQEKLPHIFFNKDMEDFLKSIL